MAKTAPFALRCLRYRCQLNLTKRAGGLAFVASERERETLPFLAFLLPSYQRLTPLLVVLQAASGFPHLDEWIKDEAGAMAAAAMAVAAELTPLQHAAWKLAWKLGLVIGAHHDEGDNFARVLGIGGDTILSQQAAAGNANACRLLLDAGCDVNGLNANRRSAPCHRLSHRLSPWYCCCGTAFHRLSSPFIVVLLLRHRLSPPFADEGLRCTRPSSLGLWTSSVRTQALFWSQKACLSLRCCCRSGLLLDRSADIQLGMRGTGPEHVSAQQRSFLCLLLRFHSAVCLFSLPFVETDAARLWRRLSPPFTAFHRGTAVAAPPFTAVH